MIEINNLTTNPVDEEFLKKIAEKILKEENKTGTILSIAFVGQGRIRALNKKYLRKNRVTDVLAFGQNQKLAPHRNKVSGAGSKIKNQNFIETFLGEVIICLREVKKNARRFGSTFERELAKVLIHGILHLLGYDHEKNITEAERMRGKEEDYLSQI